MLLKTELHGSFELSYMAPLDFDLRGSIISELLGFFAFLPLGKRAYFNASLWRIETDFLTS